MLPVVTAELPPPSGPPQPNPDVDAPPAPPADDSVLGAPAPEPSAPTQPPVPVAPPPMMPPFESPAGPAGPTYPALPPMGDTTYQPTPVPGSNGLAIAALCCGIAGLFPVAAVVAIVLGVVALNQLRHRIQRGRGMAVAGIVLGVLWLLGLVFVVVAVATDDTTPGASAAGAGSSATAAVSTTSEPPETFVDDLVAGDCFSGGKKDEIDLVTAIPCSQPHESQVTYIFELPAGKYPGEEKVITSAESTCSDKADPLLTDKAYNQLDPSFIYPDSYTWRGDRTVLCLVEAPSGTTTGSALK
jgi:hypothetical protein